MLRKLKRNEQGNYNFVWFGNCWKLWVYAIIKLSTQFWYTRSLKWTFQHPANTVAWLLVVSILWSHLPGRSQAGINFIMMREETGVQREDPLVRWRWTETQSFIQIECGGGRCSWWPPTPASDSPSSASQGFSRMVSHQFINLVQHSNLGNSNLDEQIWSAISLWCRPLSPVCESNFNNKIITVFFPYKCQHSQATSKFWNLFSKLTGLCERYVQPQATQLWCVTSEVCI